MRNHRLRVIIPFLFVLLPLITGCASKEVKNLQQSVDDLEDKMVNYQQRTSQESAETVTKVGEVNQSINNAFRDIRYAQSNMETLIDQLSNRLAKVERDVSELQQNANQLNAASNDVYSNLTDKFSNLEQASKSQRQQDLDAMQKNLNSLSSSIANLKSGQDRSEKSIQSLEKQFSSMSEENRNLYRQILKELGANAPDANPSEGKTPESKAPARAPESKKQTANPSGDSSAESGKVHEVQPGETLTRIAAQYNVSLEALKQLNQIENASDIRSGQRIKIPK